MWNFLKPVNHHSKSRDIYLLKTIVRDYKCFKAMNRTFDFMCILAENLKQPTKELERELCLNRSLSVEKWEEIYKELNNLLEMQSYYYDVAFGLYDKKLWD